RPDRPLRYAFETMRIILSQEMLVRRALPVFIYLFLLMTAYSGLKNNIAEFNGYSWDRTLSDLDRQLFLGADPWTITHALFPGQLWADFFNFFYHLWFFVMFGLWFWVAGTRADDRSRTTFLFAYGLCWAVGGVLIATSFASVGPCYYERLLGDDRYSDL